MTVPQPQLMLHRRAPDQASRPSEAVKRVAEAPVNNMPAYHSAYNGATEYREVGNMALLPLRTRTRGPAPPLRQSRSRFCVPRSAGH